MPVLMGVHVKYTSKFGVVSGTPGLPGHLVVESRSAAPLVPMRIFRSSTLVGGNRESSRSLLVPCGGCCVGWAAAMLPA